MSRNVMKSDAPQDQWEIEGLAADGPNPELKDKLALFGQFVGDWDIVENRYLQPDGSWSMERGGIHWRWILEGRGVQDTFTTIDEKTGKEIPWGTTVRFYDPKIDAWRSTWNSPRQGVVKTFIGRQVGDDIVLHRKTEEGHLVRWIFSDMTGDAFRWHSEESTDGGKTWTTKETMKVRRRRE